MIRLRFSPRRLAAAAAVLLATSLVSDCSTNPATGRSSFTGLMSASDELKTGRDEHPKILQKFGGEYPDERVRRYVQQVGEKLVANSEVANTRFTFTVLNSDIVNAFALPGGYVYVTRGLMALASTEAELAGVLGHEIGHVAARHTAERYSAAVASQIGTTILGVALGVLTGSNAVAQSASDVGSSIAGTALAGFSRDQESEADELGVRYLAKSGYDDNAMVSFLSKLEADSQLSAELAGKPGTGDDFSIMQSHPRTADRVRDTIETVRKQGGAAANPRIGGDDYLNTVDGLYWGGDRENGWALDRVFVHPGLRIRFEAPQGFHLMNDTTAVIGLGPDQARIQFDSGPAPGANGARATDNVTPHAYLQRAGVSGIEDITINGLQAATGLRRTQTSDGTMDVRVVAIRADARTTYRFFFVTPPTKTAQYGEPFRRTTYSFGLLTPAEVASLQPPRLRSVTVASGDTVETLAGKMAEKDHAAQRFRVMNGLASGQQPRPGQRVKIVAAQ